MKEIIQYTFNPNLATQNDLMRQDNPSFNGIPPNLPPGQYLIFPEGSGNEPVYLIEESKMKQSYIGSSMSRSEGGFRVGLGVGSRTPEIITPNLANLEERLDKEDFNKARTEVERLDLLGKNGTLVFVYSGGQDKPTLINEIYQDLPVKVNGITISQNFKYELKDTFYKVSIGKNIEFLYVRIEQPSAPVIITK